MAAKLIGASVQLDHEGGFHFRGKLNLQTRPGADANRRCRGVLSPIVPDGLNADANRARRCAGAVRAALGLPRTAAMIGAWSFIAQQLFESLLRGETTLKSWNRSTLVSRSQLSITDVSPVAVTPSEVEDPARSTVALPEVEAEQQESDQRVECEHQEPDESEKQEPETQSAVELRD